MESSEILALKTEFSSYWGPGEHLIDYSKVERAGSGQGAIFTQGSDKAALHASPREYVFQTRITLVIDKCDVSVVDSLNSDSSDDDSEEN